MLKKEMFIKNLSEITRGIKQKEIAAIMGCTEGTISKYLNPDKKDFPPVDKLYNIAEHFKVSIDWLVGVQIQQEDVENKFETYSDIFRLLFSLGELFNIDIIDIMASDVSDGMYEPAPFGYRFDTIVSQGIGFGDEIIDKILKEWKTFLEIKEKVEYWEEPYKSWKEGVLNRYNVKIKDSSPNPLHTDETFDTKIGDSFMKLPDK